MTSRSSSARYRRAIGEMCARYRMCNDVAQLIYEMKARYRRGVGYAMALRSSSTRYKRDMGKMCARYRMCNNLAQLIKEI